ncbi:MAG: hypothetical protein JW841_17290 [Deltaproteobacteria bacterium]|nr:hypothetical protein [Deltaproteobacteria bacterium]
MRQTLVSHTYYLLILDAASGSLLGRHQAKDIEKIVLSPPVVHKNFIVYTTGDLLEAFNIRRKQSADPKNIDIFPLKK